MATKTELIIGVLILTLLATGVIYVQMGDNLRIRVDNDKTTFYIVENGRWVVSGREYNKIFDGVKLLYRNRSGIEVETNIDNSTQEVIIKRTTPYIRGPVVVDTYKFIGNVYDELLFPISHTVEIINGSGFLYQYEVRNLVYDGEAIKDVESPFGFGRKMTVEWSDENYYSKVFKSGIIKIKYRMGTDYETYSVRLFDPDDVTIDDSVFNAIYAEGSMPNNVFINSTHGYVFYSDSTGSGDLVYRKTTDGGATWGSTVIINDTMPYIKLSVWYDKWTPDDDGTMIHIAAFEIAPDDNWYYSLNTSNDATSSGSVVSLESSLSNTDGPPSITKNTKGDLFIVGPTYSVRVLSRSTDNGSTWTDITPGSWFNDDLDYEQLFPLSNGDIMAVYYDTSGNDAYEWIWKYGDSACYQEFANVSTDCGGLDTGLYEVIAPGEWTDEDHMFDGDWGTFGYINTGEQSQLDINYTKPAGANNVTWQVKDGNQTMNITVPGACWDLYADKIRFVVDGYESGNRISYWCYSGVDTTTSMDISAGTVNFYEEAVNWNISSGWLGSAASIYTDVTLQARSNVGCTYDISERDIYICNVPNNDVFYIYKYNYSEDTWALLDWEATETSGIQYDCSLAYDQDLNNLYIVFTDGIAGAMDVYSRLTTDSGSSWASAVQLNTVTDDIRYVITDFTSTGRLYATWYNDDLDDLLGGTILEISGWYAYLSSGISSLQWRVPFGAGTTAYNVTPTGQTSDKGVWNITGTGGSTAKVEMRLNDSYTSGSSSWCYQETANESTACGGLNTGNYSCTAGWDATHTCALTYDGNWSSYGRSTFPETATIYINYSKPNSALSSSKWQVKDGESEINLTIPSSCWSQTPLQFKAVSDVIDAAPPRLSYYWYCYNGTDWEDLRSHYNGGYQKIYEEAMYWYVSSSGVTTECADNNGYSSSLIVNTTWQTINASLEGGQGFLIWCKRNYTAIPDPRKNLDWEFNFTEI